jgi:peptidoglycan/LPS O-acetylase OafA/YrhL
MTALPESTSSNRAEIQGLRAIAIILVVLYHSGVLFKSGFIGVDVFFVISGYVIAASLLRELQSGRNISISGFYARRVRRLLPALALMLGTVLFLSTWLSSISSRVQTVRTGFFATFSSANLFLFRFRPDGYFVVSEKTNALLHTWSLSIEEQFYLVFPLLVALVVFIGIKRKMNSTRLLTQCLVVVAALSLFACVYISTKGVYNLPSLAMRVLGTSEIDARFAFYLPITRAWEFIAGSLIALVGFRRISTSTETAVGLLGVLMIVVSALLFGSAQSFPGFLALLPVLGTMLVIQCARPANPLGKLLTLPTLGWIGDRSYGWYLWHWPMIQFVKPFYPDNRIASLCAGLLAIVPAALSYRFIENRFRHGQKWRNKKMMGLLVAASLGIPVLAGISSRPLMPELDNHIDAQMGCEYGDLDNLNLGGSCEISVEGGKGFTILLGDSHAGMYSEAFIKASNDLGLSAIISTNSNRPFLFRPWDMESTREEFPYQVIEKIASLKMKPSAVVIGQSGYDMGTTNGETWSEMFVPILKQLEELDIAVVVIGAAFSVGIEPQSCSNVQSRFGKCPFAIEWDTNSLDQSRSGRLVEEQLAVKMVRNTVLLNTIEVLCPDSTCSTYRNGKWWWRDNAHVSITASLAMAPLMELKLSEALKLQETLTD